MLRLGSLTGIKVQNDQLIRHAQQRYHSVCFSPLGSQACCVQAGLEKGKLSFDGVGTDRILVGSECAGKEPTPRDSFGELVQLIERNKRYLNLWG